MTNKKATRQAPLQHLQKTPTGIQGFDALTRGGLPKGRPTLVCGGAGSGKTLFGMEFLVRGARDFNEPGVALTFEETDRDLEENVASLGFDLADLQRRKKLLVDFVRVERSEIEETGEYNLDGLFVRLQDAVERVGARRVLLDTIESLFAGLSDKGVLRAELRRLFGWLKERRLTTVVTGERGENTLTRQGLEEYVSDCVILLDHRVQEQTSTRRLRIVKYRGSSHGTNEYPFLIGSRGFSILPITSLELEAPASASRLSTGVPGLDEMLGGEGYFRGSSILISGTAGSGKSSLAASLALSAARRGETALYFSFEESCAQIVRNLGSIGLDLAPELKRGRLRIISTRPSFYGLEMHLVTLHQALEELRPSVVILDPVTDLLKSGSPVEVHAMLTRLIDFMKGRNITALMTSLTTSGSGSDDSEVGISSLIDTWIVLQNFQIDGERNRGISVLKSRGMAHSNMVREFILSGKGIDMVDVYVSRAGILTGASRRQQQARDVVESERLAATIVRKRAAKAAKLADMDADIAADEAELLVNRKGKRA